MYQVGVTGGVLTRQHRTRAACLAGSALALYTAFPALMRAALTWHRAGGFAGTPGCCRREKRASRRSELQRLAQAVQQERDSPRKGNQGTQGGGSSRAAGGQAVALCGPRTATACSARAAPHPT
jgi:hypothetical protein